MVEGFFEWKTQEHKGERFKQPYYVQSDANAEGCSSADDESSAPLLIAGLWDVCDTLDAAGDPQKLYTYAILTENSSKKFSEIHTRMPVMFRNWDEADAWLRIDKIKYS